MFGFSWFRLCYRFYVIRLFFFFKQKTAYEMRISDWSSDVCSSDLAIERHGVVYGSAHAAHAFVALELHQPGGLGALQEGVVERFVAQHERQIGRASCRERVCQYV